MCESILVQDIWNLINSLFRCYRTFWLFEYEGKLQYFLFRYMTVFIII